MQDFADIFKHKNEIREQIKTKNIPYIPGTSIKGAIRTALLWYYAKNNFNDLKNILETELNNKTNKKFIGNKFVDTCFNLNYSKKDAKYDLLKFLEVSDFMPDEQNKNMKIDKIETYALAKKKVNFRKGVIKKFESIGFKQYIETLNGNFTGTIKLSPQ
ncbi:MAG: type III-A CRISPR-associated RAMP protein Csm5, partial [Candidatus Aenigmarchaeota archaeon ex4484_52]